MIQVNIKETESLYKILRSHDIVNLKQLSDKIASRLKVRFNNIGDLYDAADDEIRMSYIKEVRVNKIRTAVKEYMAG